MAKKVSQHTMAAEAARVKEQAAETAAAAYEVDESLEAIRKKAERVHRKINSSRRHLSLAERSREELEG